MSWLSVVHPFVAEYLNIWEKGKVGKTAWAFVSLRTYARNVFCGVRRRQFIAELLDRFLEHNRFFLRHWLHQARRSHPDIESAIPLSIDPMLLPATALPPGFYRR